MTGLRGFALCLALTWAAVAQAGTLTLDHLESLLAVSARGPVQYQELRESPWLQKAEHSYGTLYLLPDFLEKRVEFPQREVWRLYSDRIVRVESDNGVHQEIVFGDSRQIAVFINAFQCILAGKPGKLEPDFQLNLTGDESNWTLRFKPRSADVQQYLEWIEARGSGSALREIIALEPGGDRTTTHFLGSRN